MPRQDWDPLADTLPPRYAYESDDEDETGLGRATSGSAPDGPAVDVTFSPSVEGGKKEEKVDILFAASGSVAAVWARGANLGEQVGQVNVNKRAIGLLFRPTWTRQGTRSLIIVSEALTRLPVWAENPYADAVLERWKPSKVILLDAYSTATYISPTPIPHHEAPLRYLSTERTAPSSRANVPLSLFAPPNLLQSTTAAFLNLLALPRTSSGSQAPSTGLAILVPSRRTPLPAPRSLSREDENPVEENGSSELVNLSGLEDAEDWDPVLLHEAHGAVLESVGVTGSAEEWTDARARRKETMSPKTSRRRRVTETEGGMYI